MPDVGFHCPQLGVELEYCYLHLVRWRESCVCTWKGPSIAGLVVEEMELDKLSISYLSFYSTKLDSSQRDLLSETSEHCSTWKLVPGCAQPHSVEV